MDQTSPIVSRTPAVDPLADAHCLHCGYSLRGLPENRCPECGTAFDPEKMATTFILLWPRLMAWYLAAHVAVGLLVFARWTIWYAAGTRKPSVLPALKAALLGFSWTPYRDLIGPIALGLLGAVGLSLGRDWGRKVCLILYGVVLCVSIWPFLVQIPFSPAQPGDTFRFFVGRVPSLLSTVVPATIIIMLLITGLRPRSLARGWTSKRTILSLGQYHPQQDWLLTLVALLVAIGFSQGPDLESLGMIFSGRWRLLHASTLLDEAADIGICLSCGLAAIWIWRRPERTRTALASLAALVSAVALSQILLGAIESRPPVWISPFVFKLTMAMAMIRIVPPALALYLFAVRNIDANAVWLVTRQRARNESSAASSGS